MNPNPPRIVDMGAPLDTSIKEEPVTFDHLEHMLRMANIYGSGNNQNGTAPKNPDKERRAKRREQKLARRKNRDR